MAPICGSFLRISTANALPVPAIITAQIPDNNNARIALASAMEIRCFISDTPSKADVPPTKPNPGTAVVRPSNEGDAKGMVPAMLPPPKGGRGFFVPSGTQTMSSKSLELPAPLNGEVFPPKPLPEIGKSRPKTPGSGRKAGTLNKATAEVKELARMHGPAMIERAVWLASNAKLEQTQIAAISIVLARGYGNATQVIAASRSRSL